MQEKLTIDDIAAALGVSKTTVSRVISGKGRISEETRRRVQEYIREHDYKPSAVARGLAQRKTFNIGVVCPTDYELFQMPFFHKCLQGISDVTAQAGYDVLLSMTERGDVTNLKRVVGDNKVDGIILTRTMFDDPLADYLKSTQVPFVALGSSPDPALVQIDNDHFSACRELTALLTGAGVRRPALIGCDEKQIITETRRKGFLAGLADAGLPEDPSLIYLDASSEGKTTSIVRDAQKKGADALICMDEKITGYALTACRICGICVPRDMKVASFYNSSVLDLMQPAVTAVDVDDSQLGRVAADTLLKMIAGEEPGNCFLRSYRIIVRESTASAG